MSRFRVQCTKLKYKNDTINFLEQSFNEGKICYDETKILSYEASSFNIAPAKFK